MLHEGLRNEDIHPGHYLAFCLTTSSIVVFGSFDKDFAVLKSLVQVLIGSITKSVVKRRAVAEMRVMQGQKNVSAFAT